MNVPPSRNSQPIYLIEMMERLGIDPSAGARARLGLSYATAFHRCEACPSKQACRDWLDRMPRSVTFAPRFCPTADILFELQVDQPACTHARSDIASENKTGCHAHMADLERLEDEIDEILIRKSTDDASIIGLKLRRSYLRSEIERLHHEAVAIGRPH